MRLIAAIKPDTVRVGIDPSDRNVHLNELDKFIGYRYGRAIDEPSRDGFRLA